MRNLRKLMAVIVSVAIMASLLVAPAFAEQTMTDVEVCELLDVLRGTGSGLTAEYLASKPQRYQAARLFLRLQGLEDDALAFPGTANFSDVEAMPDWQFAAENKAVLAYLYANPELGFVGYTDGTFRPFNEISAMEYYKVLLTALGYEQNVDYVYGDDLLDFAASLGLSEVADVEEFSIMHLATATVEALKAVVKDGEETLLEKLVADGVIDEDVAAETGIYEGEVVAAELAVESLSADNLAEVYVKFNQAMDKDTITKDYFKVAGAKVAGASLLADDVTVKLTVDKAKIGGNGSNYKVEITTDVKSASGAAFEKAYSGNIRVFDNELPYITDVRLTGPKTIEITFSEPMEVEPKVKINKGVYGCSIGAIKTVTNKVIVTISASKLPDGEYTLAISDAEDYAGFKMDADEHLLAYAKDESPITASVTSAKQSEVKVKFNKPVMLTDEATSYFYHTFSKWNPDSVNNDDGEYYDSYTLTFTDNPIPEGETQFVIKAKGKDGTAIRDAWGNKLEENIAIKVSVAADRTPPEVTGDVKVKDDAQTIEIKFTEPLNKASAEKKANYAVEDEDGKEVKVKSASYTDKDDVYLVTIKFDKELSGNYTIVIKDVKDASVNENEIKETTLSFFVGDKKAPDLSKMQAENKVTAIESNVKDEKDIIYVTYPEKMCSEDDNRYSVLDSNNYLLSGKKLPDKTTLDLVGTSGTVVKITIPSAEKQKVVGEYLTIARVADAAGNVTAELSYKILIAAEDPPKVEKIEQTAANKLTVTIDKPLLSILEDTFVFYIDEGTDDEMRFTAADIEEWSIKDGKTTVKVVLDGKFVDELEAIGDKKYGKDSARMVDEVAGVSIYIAGEFMVSEAGKAGGDEDDEEPYTTFVTGIVDKWAPSFVGITEVESTAVSADVYNSTVEIEFSETLGTPTSDWAHDLVISKLDGKALVANTDYETEVNGKILKVTIKGHNVLAKADDEEYYTIATKDSITYIKGADGNKIVKFDEKDIVEPEEDD
jgi:hypothetical protein